MKKSLFTLAAAALALASCTSDDILVDQNVNANNKETAIGFSTFANKATRAENSLETAKTSLFDHHANFAVWGFKDVDVENYVFGSSTTVGTTVSGAAVTPATDPATYTWTYSPVRFWDKNSNRYDFYAAAPVTASDPQWTLNGVAGTTNAAENPQAGYFTLADVTLADKTLTATDYTQSMKAQANTDYMIADEKHVINVNYGSGDVAFDFNHILSRLNITVKRGSKLETLATTNSDDAKLNIVKLEVRNMIAKGSFDESKKSGTELSNGTIGRWTRTTDKMNYTAHAANAADLSSTKVYVLQSLIMPQEVAFANVHADGREVKSAGTTTDPYLYIEYQIGTTTPETFKAYYNLADLFSQNVTYTAVDATTLTVGTSDVSNYYVDNGTAKVRATGVAETGVTYYTRTADNVSFFEGWQNNINLTIDVDAITFTANVYKWDDNKSNNFDIE